MEKSDSPQPSRSSAISQAVREAAHRLQISAADLGAIIGVSPTIATQLLGGADCLHESSEPWELSVRLVEFYRLLSSLVGSDDHLAKGWLYSANRALGGARPIDHIKRNDGLIYVCDYLGERRARV